MSRHERIDQFHAGALEISRATRHHRQIVYQGDRCDLLIQFAASKRREPTLTLFHQPQRVAYELRSRYVAPAGELRLDERLEVLSESAAIRHCSQ